MIEGLVRCTVFARMRLVNVDNCELCEAVPFTKRFYEDDLCWIAECESCDVPMVVWRSHGATPPEDLVETMLGHLRSVAEAEFADRVWFIDRVMRQIPDHFHAHARVDRWASPTKR